MATEGTEIARMVVRLVGDTTQYVKTLNQAAQLTGAQTKAASDHVKVHQKAMADAIKTQTKEAEKVKREEAMASVALNRQQTREAAVMQRQAAAIARSFESESDIKKRKIGELTPLLKYGHITQDTYNKAVAAIKGPASVSVNAMEGIRSSAGRLTRGVRGVSDSMSDFALSSIAMLGGLGLASSLSGAFDRFTAMENAVIGLTIAIRVNGRDVDSSMEIYNDYIKTVTATTLATKAHTIQLLANAEAQGFSGKQAMDVVTWSLALAKGNGELAESSMRAAAMMARGHPEMARRMLGLQGVMSHTKMMQIIQRRLDAQMEEAGRQAQSTSGKIQKLKRSFVEFSTELGGVVADMVGPFVDALAKIIESFNKLDAQTKRTVVHVVAGIMAFLALKPVLMGLAFVFGPVIAVIKLFFVLLGAIFTPIGAIIAVVLSLAAVFLYFSGAAGAALEWFKERWADLHPIATKAIKGISDAIKAGNIELAWKIAWTGVKVAFAESIIDLREMWVGYTTWMAESMIEATSEIKRVWEGGTTWMALRLVELQRDLGMISEEEFKGITKILLADMNRELGVIETEKRAMLQIIGDEGRADIARMKEELKNLNRQLDDQVKQAADEAKGIKIPELKVPPIKPMTVKVIPKFDAAAFASAEAVTRIQEWRDKLQMGRASALAGKEAIRFDAAPGDSAEAFTREQDQRTILKEILDVLKDQAKKPGLPVVPVGL